MTIYTVHEPPKEGNRPNAERIRFVRDGFYWSAFLLAPFWMLWRRLWLVFIFYVIVVGLMDWSLARLGASSSLIFTVNVLVLLLIGIEAGSLVRWTLRRKRWRMLDVVSADTREEAERRFFDKWSAAEQPAPQPHAVQSAPVMLPARRVPAGTDVVGLFPEPGARM